MALLPGVTTVGTLQKHLVKILIFQNAFVLAGAAILDQDGNEIGWC